MTPGVWRNWARTYEARPGAIHRPGSVAEVVPLVRAAAQRGRRLRCAGSGHSFSEIARPADELLLLDRCDRILALDREAGTVTVEAGIRLEALAQALAALRLGLPLLGTTSRQTVAGAISTGTHGTGGRSFSLSEQVTALELVTPSGETLRISLDENEHLLPAARVSLGALGVVTKATLPCRPAFSLHSLARPTTFDDALDEVAGIVGAHGHAKLWWWPHTDEVRSWQYDETDEKPSRIAPAGARFHPATAAAYAGWGALWLGSKAPRSLVPRLAQAVVPRVNRRHERTARSDRVFNYPVPMPHLELEYGIDRRDGPAALRDLREAIRERDLAVDFLVEVRFNALEEAWLSPAFGRETCYVGALLYRRAESEAYYDAVEEVMARYGGRPHWGKIHSRTAAELRELYPRFDDFRALRQELDPDGVFVNDYVERVLGP